MHSFVWIAGSSAESAERRATQALGALRKQWVDIGAGLELKSHRLGGFRGALATLGPAEEYTPPLLDLASDGERFAFCFGRITGERTPAARILREFRLNGTFGARLLDGSFTAIVCETARQRFWAFTDLIGMRSVRLSRFDSCIALASHDLALVATGAVDSTLDLDSVASVVACDWSLGGRSLLAGVQACGGNEVVSYEQGRLSIEYQPTLSLNGRVDRADKVGKRRVLDDMAAELERATDALVASEGSLRFSLTAGRDSRVLLALLARHRDRDIVAQTNGSPDSLDVRVARRLARLAGVRHQIADVPRVEVGAFSDMVRLLSLSMNGMTNAKRALARMPAWDPQRRPLAGGEGGEIYTGFFYRCARGAPRTAGGAQLGPRLVKYRFQRLAGVRFADPGCVARVTERLTQSLDHLALISDNTHDLLDLFYMYERYALWGAYGERSSWTRRWTPYANTSAIRHAYRLPAPIGIHCTVHERLIRRYLPLLVYLTPVNGADLLLLSGGGKPRELARRTLKELAKSRWIRGSNSGKLEDGAEPRTRASIFARELNEYLQDSLLGEGSVALDLLGRRGVRDLLTEHRTRENQLQVLGFLVTAEAFRLQARDLVRRAD